MSIYIFSDYRAYLRDYIQKLPKKGRGEVGQIARYLRIHSSLISQILSGSKDFSHEQAQDLTSYLGLNTLETDYFILLVQHSKAGTKKLKDYLKNKLGALDPRKAPNYKLIPQGETEDTPQWLNKTTNPMFTK